MKIKGIVKGLGRYISNHSETILTVVGVIGVTATTILSAKAAPKANEAIAEEQETQEEPLTFWQKVNVAGVKYIPTAAAWFVTCACIVASNVISEKKKAGLMLAYSSVVSLFERYKSKMTVDELRDIEYQIAQDAYNRQSIEEMRGTDTVLFYDELSDRFFEKSMEEFHAAMNELNNIFDDNGYAWVNNFYEALGEKSTEEGDWLGWSCSSGAYLYGYSYIRATLEPMDLDNRVECYYISFDFAPTDILQEEEQIIPLYPGEV